MPLAALFCCGVLSSLSFSGVLCVFSYALYFVFWFFVFCGIRFRFVFMAGCGWGGFSRSVTQMATLSHHLELPWTVINAYNSTPAQNLS